MAEARGKWWWRLLLVISVGPGAIMTAGTLSALPVINSIRVEYWMIAVHIFYFALWGLTAGVLQRSLLKALIGLSFGAFVGAFTAKFFLSPMGRAGISHSLTVASAGLLLGSALAFRKTMPVSSCAFGALAGMISFGSIELISWLFPYDSLTVVCLRHVPGLYLFFWLIADVLPRREAAREKAKSSPPSAL